MGANGKDNVVPSDSREAGSIPATLFINNKTGYRKFIEEKISQEKLKEEIKALLEKN